MLKHKNLMRVVRSDIFDMTKNIVASKNLGCSVVIPHVCNNIGLFGGGFAAAVRNNFPIVATNFELLGKTTKLGYVQYVKAIKDDTYDHELVFANMVAQNGIIGQKNTRPLNYEALVRCMIDVRNFIKNADKEKIEIHCPRFGSGLAGGDWNFINDLITDIWSGLPITIYGPPCSKK